ncbi:MAG: HAMP domain-containing histidine kinase [Tannerella sp.]|jgi:signal transduction histidine kinase|nr:HAMP domain-containing histidine kinase [Tannerella sp.]
MNNQDQTKEIFCIDDLLEEMYAYVSQELQKRGKSHVKVEILKYNYTDFEKVSVRTNRLRLQQIFTNLLDNVAKVTDRGYIFFGYHTGGDNIISFFVDDTGIGIYNDSDLELSIAQGLVQQMGGKISIEPCYDAGQAIKFDINCEIVG